MFEKELQPKDNPSTTIRAFLALPITDNLRQEIENIILKLKNQNICRDLKWTKPKNLHITMRFLGNITWQECAKLSQTLNLILQGLDPFQVTLSSLMLFPQQEHPIAVILKPKTSTALNGLAATINDVVLTQGLAVDKRAFNAHLTLARIKHHVNVTMLTTILEKIELPKMILEVDQVTLVQSSTSAHGSVYTQLAKFPLGKIANNN
jgi:RNA 2',3'-cyclic 3'-phosphodiesterase